MSKRNPGIDACPPALEEEGALTFVQPCLAKGGGFSLDPAQRRIDRLKERDGDGGSGGHRGGGVGAHLV